MKRRAACVLAVLLLVPAAAAARDTLPWKDANPVGRTGERPKAKPAHRRAEAPKTEQPTVPAAAGAAAAVPVPEARPAVAPEPAAPEPASPEPASPEPPSDVTPTLASDVAKPEARPADAPAPALVEGNEKAPGAPAVGDPAMTEIPVPDARPAPTPAETAPAPTAEPSPQNSAVPDAAPLGSSKAPEPAAKAEEAPNSTEKLKSRLPDVTPAATVEAAAAVEDSMACEAELTSRGVDFTVEETISEGECGVLRPIALKRLSTGIAVAPRTQMLCRTALALDDWMTKSVVPSAKTNLPGETLTEFRHASTYVCRPRASETGISEHARGSAIDIGSFVFKSGREISIAAKEPNTPDETFLEDVRAGACGPFKTVLGPGTDADHATHFHLDIAARKNAATYCK